MKPVQVFLFTILGIEFFVTALLYTSQFYIDFDTTVLMGGFLLAMTPVLWAAFLRQYVQNKIVWYSTSTILWTGSALFGLCLLLTMVFQHNYQHAIFGNALEETTFVFLFIFFTHVLVLHHLITLTKRILHILVVGLGFIHAILLLTSIVTQKISFDLSLYLAITAAAFLLAAAIALRSVKGRMFVLYYGVFLSLLPTLVLFSIPTPYLVLLLIMYVYTFFFRIEYQMHLGAAATAPVLLGCILGIGLIVPGVGQVTHVGLTDGVTSVHQTMPVFNAGVIQNDRSFDAVFGEGLNSVPYIWYQYNDHALQSVSDLDNQPEFFFSTAVTYAISTGFFGVISWLLLLSSLIYWRISLSRPTLTAAGRHRARNICFFFGLLLLFGTVLQYVTVLVAAVLIAIAAQCNPEKPRKGPVGHIRTYLFFFCVLLLSIVFIRFTVSVVHANIQYEKAVDIITKNGNSEMVQSHFEAANKAYTSALISRRHSQFLQSEVRALLAADQGDQAVLEELLSDSVASAADAIVANRYDYESWLVLGNAYFIMARLDIKDAEKSMNVAYQKAVELAPQQPKAWYAFALATQSLGRYDESESHVGEALTLYPQYVAAEALQAELSLMYQEQGADSPAQGE